MIQILKHHKFVSLIGVGAIALSNISIPAQSQAEPLAQANASGLELSPATSQADAVPTDAIKEEAQSTSVATYIKQGNDAYVEADYDRAVEAYSQALELYNQNAYAYYNRGNAYRKLKNEEAALQDYTLAVRLNPDNYYAYYYRGMILAKAKNYQQALADFSTALDLNDQTPFIYVKRAETYRQLDNKDAAKDDYEAAIKLYKKQGKDLKAEMLQRKLGGVRR